MDYKGKTVLVVGIKSSGVSAITLLEKLGANIKIYDDNNNVTFNGYVNLRDESVETILKEVDLVVISPSIPNEHRIIEYAKENGIEIISELELGLVNLNCKKIIVTGTNGKTTIVEMLDYLISSANIKTKKMGNVGYPVTQVVLDNEQLDCAIVEASSFQLEYIKNAKADIALLTNITPDHMDRYDSFNDYISAKSNIFLNQTKKDFAIVNLEDINVKKIASTLKSKVIGIKMESLRSPVHIKNKYYYLKDKPLASIKNSNVKGKFNHINILFALNVGYLLGIKEDCMINLIKNFKTSAHRLEYVCTLDNKNYYNDSKGTNIDACIKAIDVLNGSIGLILGGSDKNEDFCFFFENISSNVNFVCVTGNNADKIYTSAQKMGYTYIKKFNDLKSALLYLANMSYIDNVLFSPASASFDRYSSYVERGNKFKELVYEIKA